MVAAKRSRIAKSARLPNRVAEYRGRAGLSQHELADRVGVTQTQIGKIERGDLALSLSQALKLAHVLGCRSYELLGLPDSPSRRAQQLIELFDRLSGSQQETLLTLGRALAEEPARFEEEPPPARRDRRA